MLAQGSRASWATIVVLGVLTGAAAVLSAVTAPANEYATSSTPTTTLDCPYDHHWDRSVMFAATRCSLHHTQRHGPVSKWSRCRGCSYCRDGASMGLG